MSAVEEQEKLNRIIHTSYNTDFRTIASLMQQLDQRQRLAIEYHNTQDKEFQDNVIEAILYCNDTIKDILAL